MPKKKSCDNSHDFTGGLVGGGCVGSANVIRPRSIEYWIGAKERVIGFEPTTFTLAT